MGERLRPKICIATPEFPPQQWGGLARTVERVSRHARDMGLEVHVACFTIDPEGLVLLDENRQTQELDGISVHRLKVGKERMTDSGREIWDCPHTLTIQMMYQSLEMLHRDKGFDFFHSFFLYPVGYITGLLAKRYGVPCVATIVGNDIKKYTFSPEKVAVCRSGLENADRVIALSHDLVEMADALTPIKQKAGIIYNSVVIPDQAWSADRPPGRSFRVGCAGIFKYAKGLPYLFKALAQLRSEASLVLELSGELRPSEKPIHEQMLERTGIQDLVVLREPLPHYRVPEWLRSLDLFVLPSLSEGCPNILMEALATGVPSIATRTGANEDLIDDHMSGLLVPWGDSAALARALKEMLENKDLRQTLGSAARLKMQHFSPARERRDWERIYRDLIGF